LLLASKLKIILTSFIVAHLNYELVFVFHICCFFSSPGYITNSAPRKGICQIKYHDV